jgi:hypothetical protein
VVHVQAEDEVAPVDEVFVEGGQRVQDVAPAAAAKLPCAQSVHGARPVEEDDPTAQTS